MKELNIKTFEKAADFIMSLPEKDGVKVFAHIKSMAKDLSSVNIKLLKSPIKELKVKKYRLLFFVKRWNYLHSFWIYKKDPENSSSRNTKC